MSKTYSRSLHPLPFSFLFSRSHFFIQWKISAITRCSVAALFHLVFSSEYFILLTKVFVATQKVKCTQLFKVAAVYTHTYTKWWNHNSRHCRHYATKRATPTTIKPTSETGHITTIGHGRAWLIKYCNAHQRTKWMPIGYAVSNSRFLAACTSTIFFSLRKAFPWSVRVRQVNG